MDMYTACFFGHREVMHNIKKILTDTIENLIVNKKVNNFYVGNQGQFDNIVYTVLKELKKNIPISNTALFWHICRVK